MPRPRATGHLTLDYHAGLEEHGRRSAQLQPLPRPHAPLMDPTALFLVLQPTPVTVDRHAITWRGGLTTSYEVVRSVSRYESLSAYPALMKRIRQLRKGGLTIAQVAARLNEEGHKAPRSRQGYTATSVRKLLSRLGQKAGRADKPSAQGGSETAASGK